MAVTSARMSSTAEKTAEQKELDADEKFFRDCFCRGYWGAVCKDPRSRRPPVVTISCIAACVAVWYANEGPPRDNRGWWYRSGPDEAWYLSLGAMFSHVSEDHLWGNTVIALMVMTFYELTEGYLKTIAIVWGAGTLGFALNALVRPSHVIVRGFSGCVYGLIAAQLSVLKLNWAEMPCRWTRVLILLLAFGSDSAVYFVMRRTGVSYGTHLFGALAGISITGVTARNVNMRRFEQAFSWAGLCGYIVMELVAFAGEQTAAASLSLAVVPILLYFHVANVRRACAKRRAGEGCCGRALVLEQGGARETNV